MERKGRKGALEGLLLVVLLPALASVGSGCDLGGKRTGLVRDSVQDPLVRERVLERMEEIYAPAKQAAEEVRSLTARKECGGVCEKSGSICDAAARLCDLAADYSDSDEEVQERCQWSTTDCDSSRSSCAGCGGPKVRGEEE
ncbi:MAG: hypothetical protein FJ125_04360 [Deltaproteobacteria bacterium]|nr:hypothetical protein [Deltaproteobacteria bacterium]